MNGYIVVKLYENMEWAPSTVAVEDYPEHSPWGRDSRGAFRYVRLPASMWANMEDLNRRRQTNGCLPPLLEEAELLIHKLAAALLCRPNTK